MAKKKPYQTPPNWAVRFLRWYCNPEILEEIEGDLCELYDRKITNGQSRLAYWSFVWNVIRFFRLSNIRNSNFIRSNSTIMFRNYIKIGLRNMAKYWSTSFINIFGLSLAVACFITIFIFIDMQLSMDGFHARKNDIYQIIMKVDTENGIEQWGDTSYPLSQSIASDISGIEGFFRIEYQYANVRYDKNVFREFLVFTDPGYLDFLDFKVLKGDPTALRSFDKIVLSYHTAIKYFGEDDPIGKQLSFKFEGSKSRTFEVGAVLEAYPENNSFNYDFLLPMSQFEQLALSKSTGWDYLTDANFIVLDSQSDPEVINSLLEPYLESINSALDETTTVGFRLVPLSKLSSSGFEIIGAIANFSNPAARIALLTIVTLLTLLASFNYMNISVASATRRLREIGIRKVMGSYKSQITHQFLTENLLQICFSLVIGTLMCYFLLLPGFNSLLPIVVPFSFSSISTMISLFVGLMIFIALVSSAYPSLFIARFSPGDILRGSQRFGDKTLFSNVLLGFQLVIAFLTIVGCFMFTDNAIHQRNIDWGYEKQGLISIRASSYDEFSQLKNAVSSQPGVVDVTSGHNHIGISYTGGIAQQQEKEIRTSLVKVSPDYPEKLGIQLDQGSYFSTHLERSNNREALVDPLFVKRMGWENPVGQRVKIEGVEYDVKGVMSPVVIEQWHAYGELTPTMMVVNPKEEDRYLIVKTSESDLYAFNEKLKNVWLKVSPNDPYNGELQINVFDDFYQETRSNVIVIIFISIVSTILASMGLFGLLSFNIQKRLKELSVRKVLGASQYSIVKLISKKYSLIVLIAFVVGGVGGYFLMVQMIRGIYSDPKTNYFLPVFLSIILMTITVAGTIAGQIMSALKINPAVNLRNE